MASCRIDACIRVVDARGLCQAHYKRMRRTGDPLGTSRGELSATYSAVHRRLRKFRGRASDQLCRCGAKAATWAYDHSDSNEVFEIRSGYELPFSLDLERYEPLCFSCHSAQDHLWHRETRRAVA